MSKLTGSRCQCTVCGEYFSRVSLFDKHRYGPHTLDGKQRKCKTRDEMLAMGWRHHVGGFWTGQALPVGKFKAISSDPLPT